MQKIDLTIPFDAKWKPTYFTPAKSEFSKGMHIADFAETFLIAIDGNKKGEPIKLTAFQKSLLENLLQCDENGIMLLREALIMIPRKNGKTFLIALLLLYMLCFAPDHSQMYSAAKDLKQAQNVFRMVKAWIEYSPELMELLKIKESDNTITNRYTGAFYRAVPADTASMHGTNPFFVIVDEMHAMTSKKHRDFIESLTTGSGAQKQSLVVYISTAGATIHGTLLGELYKHLKSIVINGEDNGNIGFYCWEASEEDDITDRAVWEKANPMLAEGILEYSFFQGQLEKAAATNIAFFQRFFLNIWASVGGDPLIHPHAWAEILDETAFIADGAPIVAGFDGSVKGDSTVIVIQDIETGVTKIWDIWERPDDAGPDFFISRRDIENSFIKLAQTYDLKLIYADRFYYENDLKEWAYDYDWNIVLIHQGGGQMKQFSADLQKDVAEKVISHVGQEALTRHIANTFADDNKGFAKEDRYSLNKIDACVATMLANGARNFLRNIDDTPTQVVRFS
jgi:phage terminase large subunit-like protein